jgi:hypothetical protein
VGFLGKEEENEKSKNGNLFGGCNVQCELHKGFWIGISKSAIQCRRAI